MRLTRLLRIFLPLGTVVACGATPSPRPAAVDIAVLAVELAPAPAGQPTDARVTIANHGTRPLEPQDYVIRVEAPGTADELRRNACGDQRIHVFVDAPVTIEPGTTEVITVHHIFARQGTYPVTVRAILEIPEDGCAANDAMTLTTTVPPSACCHSKSATC